jgi:hypothetical protein
VYGTLLLAVIPDKAERELNAESRRAAESQGNTAITLAMRPNAVITELASGWLKVPQALLPQVKHPSSAGGRGGGRGGGWHAQIVS